MIRISEKYANMIDQYYHTVKNTNEYEIEKEKTLLKLFNSTIVKDIELANGKMKVVMDREFAKAIIIKIKQCQEYYKNDFKNFQKKIQYLASLSKIVYDEHFITKRDKISIDRKFSEIKNTVEYQFRSQFKLLQGSQDCHAFRLDFFDIAKIKNNNDQDIDEEDDEQVAEGYIKFYENSMKNIDKKLLVNIDKLIENFQGKDKQLLIGKQFSEKLNQYMKDQIGIDNDEIEINNILRKLAVSEALETNTDHKQKIEELYQYVKGILKKFSGLKCFTQQLKLKMKVAIFGSNISGFASKNTDMDLTILTNCYIDERSLLKILFEFMEDQLNQRFQKRGRGRVKGGGYSLNFIETARIPLVKLNFSGDNGEQIHFDIIVNNILGVINSKFLSVYAKIDWIKNLGILIKTWAKNNGLVNQSLFSSYSMNLLMLSFLIETSRVNLILDARTRQTDASHFQYKRCKKGQFETFSVYYQFKNDSKYVTELKRVSLYELFTQFIEYYSEKGGHWKLQQNEQIITVDGSKNKQFDKEFIFTVKDPFDEKHNPGRVKSSQRNNIMQKFENALSAMKSKNILQIKQLFQGRIYF